MNSEMNTSRNYVGQMPFILNSAILATIDLTLRNCMFKILLLEQYLICKQIFNLLCAKKRLIYKIFNQVLSISLQGSFSLQANTICPNGALQLATLKIV
jgi:hypothetical protein